MTESFAPGTVRPFHSTLQGRDGFGILVRRYTGQNVTVLRQSNDVDVEIEEPLYVVRAADGAIFSAWHGELSGFHRQRIL